MGEGSSRYAVGQQAFARIAPGRASNLAMLALGAALGAGVAYLVDPYQGARRRAELLDRSSSFARAAAHRGGRLARHSRNRLEGVLASLAEPLRPYGAASDRKLAARIRSRLGHQVKHLERLELEVRNGDVTVRGKADESEIAPLLRAIAEVRGVRSVTDSFERAAPDAPVQ